MQSFIPERLWMLEGNEMQQKATSAGRNEAYGNISLSIYEKIFN